jgi:hypothetical protein
MSNQPTELTDQDKTERSDKRKRQLETTYHCTHLLSVLIERPELWPTSEFKRIRECIFTMRANPQTYGPVVGDTQPDCLINQESNQPTKKLPALTTNYILDIAKHKDVDVASPILQVVSASMAFEHTSQRNKSNAMHITHLRLCDGSCDVMVGCLSMNIAHEGNKL